VPRKLECVTGSRTPTRGAWDSPWSLLLLCGLVVSCRGSGTSELGPADSYLLFDPAPAKGGGGGDPLLFRPVALDDRRALPLHRSASDGFVGEILRTDYLVKQLIRDGYGGKSFPAAARARANEPSVLVLSGSRAVRADEAVLGDGFSTHGMLGNHVVAGRPLWIEIGEDPASDPAFVQTASGRIARLVAERLTTATHSSIASPPTATNPARALVDGYALAMEVIAREWRVGEGPQGTLPPDAGTSTQRERFAGVRRNAYVLSPDDSTALRPGREMVRDPGVIAAVIYRMAQLKGIGRKVGPKEIYAPFVAGRIPEGISPAAVLGPVRNFQAKLFTAWARAILDGHPPEDLIDLVLAYAAALPDEKNEVFRVFVATTYGATLKPGGVSVRSADATSAVAELTALAAEMAAGRRSPRAAIDGSTASVAGKRPAPGGAPP